MESSPTARRESKECARNVTTRDISTAIYMVSSQMQNSVNLLERSIVDDVGVTNVLYYIGIVCQEENHTGIHRSFKVIIMLTTTCICA